jgi:DNA mismatch repair ATPase MutS
MIEVFDNLKNIYPDKIILFRVGDSYELYKEDAEYASGVLHINAISNAEGILVVNFSIQDLDKNIEKLVKSGLRIAVYDEKL